MFQRLILGVLCTLMLFPLFGQEEAHKVPRAVVVRQALDGAQGARDRVEDARHLRVLVDEEERVGHVAVAKVDDAEADFHLDELNRDTDNVQRVISHEDFAIEIPGINLGRWARQVDAHSSAAARWSDGMVAAS